MPLFVAHVRGQLRTRVGGCGQGWPQPHSVVLAGGGQPVPVGGERHTSTLSVWPVSGSPSVGRQSASHTRTVVSGPAVASQVPVGAERHTEHWAGVASGAGLPGGGWPVCSIRRRTVPSAPALASLCSSGLNATLANGKLWP